jgi:hypothetical protein
MTRSRAALLRRARSHQSLTVIQGLRLMRRRLNYSKGRLVFIPSSGRSQAPSFSTSSSAVAKFQNKIDSFVAIQPQCLRALCLRTLYRSKGREQMCSSTTPHRWTPSQMQLSLPSRNLLCHSKAKLRELTAIRKTPSCSLPTTRF